MQATTGKGTVPIMSTIQQAYLRGTRRAWKMARTPVDQIRLTPPPSPEVQMSRAWEMTGRQMRQAMDQVGRDINPNSPDSMRRTR